MNGTAAVPLPLRGPRRRGSAPPEERSRPAGVQAETRAIRRLIAYSALAAYAAASWAGLLANPPAWRIALAVAIAIAASSGLLALGRARLSRPVAWGSAVLVTLAAVACGAIALGLHARLVLPANWGALARHLGNGIGGLGKGNYPLDASFAWARLAILCCIPLWLGLSSALAFWPRAGSPGRARTWALVILVAAYAIGAVVSPPGDALVRGLVLALCVATWLWLPGIERRRMVSAAAVVGAAALLAVPIAARLDGHPAWLDYHNWDWSWTSSASGESFDWDHTYGPLTWQRTGQVLLQVRSDAPHYWRTAVLDQFDGYRWHESATSGNGGVELPLPASKTAFPNSVLPLKRSWVHNMTFTIRGLRSQLLVGAGAVMSVHGLEGVGVEGLTGVAPTTSGLILPSNAPLTDGDTYTVRSYVPDPSPAQMRATPTRFPQALAPYREVAYPTAHPYAIVQRKLVPAWGTTDRRVGGLARSAYGRVYALARHLVAGAHTQYSAVRRIENYLRSTYSYREDTPRHKLPLRAFLFKDKAGYCQQFSGAMALMLRMVGIPTRVASGFSPGTPINGSYLVRDFDAHSWVEVYFNRIGWVTFDPTPGAAPAQSRTSGLRPLPVTALTGANADAGNQSAGPLRRTHTSQVFTPASSGSAFPWAIPLAIGVILIVASGAALGLRIIRTRALAGPDLVEAQLGELASALSRLRSWTSGGVTLMALEARLVRYVGPRSAAYAARLRAARFSSGEGSPPTAVERRALRRELGAGRGLRRRLRALAAIPPGGPQVRA